MRLRDIAGVAGLALAMFSLAGCGAIRGNNNHYEVNKQPIPHFKTDANTPHYAAQNEIALAQEYIGDGKYEIALGRLQKAVKLDPSSPDAYTMLGVLYERIGRPAQAEESYARAVKLAPDKGDILNNYGAWLCRSGHPVEADPLFRKAIADPFYTTPAAALENAAICALQAGKPDLAETYDRQVLAVDANNANALQAMATIQFQRGNYMGARGFVERFFAVGKPAPEMLDLAAKVEDKLGDRDSATSYRDRLSSEFPQYTPSQH